MAGAPGLALLGAGLFVKDQYVKILKELKEDIVVKYVWSRSQASAVAVAAVVSEYSPAVAAVSGEEGLNAVLADAEVHCVAVVLPAQAQAEIVKRCLCAHKHVIQEKPVAISVAEAQSVVEVYEQQRQQCPHPLIWAVAENYRFEPALIQAAAVVQGSGRLMAVQVTVEAPMSQGNPYFSSQWRRDPAFGGAFLTDGGVHFVAGLRLIGGCEPLTACALLSHMDPSLPPPDNLSATMALQHGALCSFLMSYSARSRKVLWRCVSEKGTVEVERGVDGGKHGYFMRSFPVGQSSPSTLFFPFEGVQAELQAFAKDVAMAQGETPFKADERSSYSEAVRDLAVIEALLISAKANANPTAVRKPMLPSGS